MKYFTVREEYITLGQLLKAEGWADDGVMAKWMIRDGKAAVNGETELRRGRKLYPGDTVTFENETVEIRK